MHRTRNIKSIDCGWLLIKYEKVSDLKLNYIYPVSIARVRNVGAENEHSRGILICGFNYSITRMGE